MLTNDQIKRLYAKAVAAQNAGKLDEAAKGYTRILKAKPNVAEAHFNLARIHVSKRAAALAARHFEAALKIKPSEPVIWLAYLDMASFHPSTANLQRLLARVGSNLDRYPDIPFYRGLVAARAGQPEARDLFEDAIASDLKSPRALTELAILVGKAGDSNAALSLYEQAIALKPNYDFALVRKSDLLRNIGRYDDALDAARAAIKAAPNVGAHYYSYTSIKKVAPDDPMIEQMKKVIRQTRKSDRNISEIGHALAKAMEDTGQTEQVFSYLNSANRATNRAFPYDHDKDKAAFASFAEAYQTLKAAAVPAKEVSAEPTPIFVTGMPRSGTTLVEQILASHSKCEGGGEMAIFGNLLSDALKFADEGGKNLSGKLVEAGQAYRAELSDRFPKARFVTDKSISSFGSIGFIKHAMPDAKIIVVRRDPRDNALSIYKNRFPDGTHRYTNDLRHIAQFYRLFEDQVAYWTDQTPNAFSQIKYEDLIADPEAQSRQLVTNAGLDWEDACLSFYDNKRRVDTLSTTQVRQPIYSSSVGAWKKYEADMAPFIEEYGLK